MRCLQTRMDRALLVAHTAQEVGGFHGFGQKFPSGLFWGLRQFGALDQQPHYSIEGHPELRVTVHTDKDGIK